MPRDRSEPIGDLVRNYDGDVVHLCQVAEELAKAYELGGALGHCEAHARLAIRVAELGAIICGNRVKDHETDVVPGDGNGELVSENVVLCFEVGGLDAEDTVEGW